MPKFQKKITIKINIFAAFRNYYPNHVLHSLNYLRFLIGAMLLILSTVMAGQSHTFEILRQGVSYSDSSFYDIQAKNDNEYWIAGKYGIIKSINTNFELKTATCDLSGIDIYKLDSFDGVSMACGDLGTVYTFDPNNDSWHGRSVKGYEKCCFYHIKICSKSSIFICGGVSAIAHSKKRIPHGFILHSTDGGLTWNKVYSNPFQMVWTIELDNTSNTLYALMYTPNRTFIYNSIDGLNWSKATNLKKGIYQDIQVENGQYFAMGGEPWGNGRLKSGNELSVFKDTGIIWSRTLHKNTEYLTGSKNILMVRSESKTETLVLPLNLEFNLYELTFMTEDKGIIVGSGGTIVKVNRQTSPPSANAVLKD
jgi:hypothetical protein